ncbi:hypothetical protein [Mesorhizobium sp. J8]|uniref:hypothetical protein n=1 Tax=Mesorhizobium sp. J8 TaxID=2777475 RepID=UPI0019153063|nr:hypothetical protein [Mesorhizobium sp. J8]BCM21646.1 hypothetical protein MJ8_54430 [Mesorhizobium sp. J8]
MIFRRSVSALHSLHIFFGVDVVVFCEGGPSLAYREAVVAAGQDGTLDTMYWSSIVSTYGIDKRFHFKSIGGKENIDAISYDISVLNIDTITVCRDSDYDRALGRGRTGKRIAYTNGYSWENDVIQLLALESLVRNLIGTGPTQSALILELREKVAKLETDLQPWTEIDVSMFVRGRGCLFDRERPLAAIDMRTPPTLRFNALAQRLSDAGYRRRPRKVVSVSVSQVTLVCYGRMLSKAIYHTVVNLLRRVSDMRIGYEVFMRLAISETVKVMTAGLIPEFASHVQQQRQAFV